jgi:hypothetical protein
LRFLPLAAPCADAALISGSGSLPMPLFEILSGGFGLDQHPVDFIFQRHALFPHFFHAKVVTWLNIGLGAMNGPVQLVILIRDPVKVAIRFTQMVNFGDQIREFFGQFVRDMGHRDTSGFFTSCT